MQADPSGLLETLRIAMPPVGFYDAPDPGPFAPVVRPEPGRHVCIFRYYEDWRVGRTLHITRESFGCPGAGRWMCDVPTREREDFLEFLAEREGLRESVESMGRWVDSKTPYRQEHPNLLIGPLRPDQYRHLKTVTFWVTPDQLSALVIGTQYHASPEDPPSVVAEFGSGCMQLAPLFADLDVPQAAIGATDIAMRRHLPADVLAFTVTRSMFERLCRLDRGSFLHKPFWRSLCAARERSET